MKIVVMAGGTGTRLWPLSRTSKPKQFQKLFSDETMLQMTVTRLLSHFSLEDIYVASNQQYKDEIRAQLPSLAESQIILEPEKRDTAPAIGFASLKVNAEAEETIAFIASDHYIHKPQELCRILVSADQFLSQWPDYILTLGITPTSPETGYGYIRYSQEALLESQGISIYPVDAFVEKPDLKTAVNYLADGRYVWNSGMFVVQKRRLGKMYEEYLPQTARALRQMQLSDERQTKLTYHQTEAISFDYGIMEKAPQIAVIPSDIGWSDIGSWASLKTILETDQTTVTHTGSAYHIDIESSDILIHSHTPGKIIATIGVHDIVIVETQDALLVSHIDQVQKVKSIVSLLQEKKLKDKI